MNIPQHLSPSTAFRWTWYFSQVSVYPYINEPKKQQHCHICYQSILKENITQYQQQNPSLGYSKKNLINTLSLLPVLCTWEGIVYNRCVHNFLFQSKKSRQINGALISRKCRFVGLGINVMIRNDCGGSKRWKWLKIVWVQKVEIGIKEDTLEVYSYREIRGLLSYIFLRSVVWVLVKYGML